MEKSESTVRNEEIEKLIGDAQSKYDDALQRLETQKGKTAKTLEKLGKQKLIAWSEDMQGFLASFRRFNNTELINKPSNLYQITDRNEHPQTILNNIERAASTANEFVKAGTDAIGTGAIVGIASHGGAVMYSHTSTGAAVATLSVTAKNNAVLTWFEGESLMADGLGEIDEKLVIGGVEVDSVLTMSDSIADAQEKNDLAAAKDVYAEIERTVTKIGDIISYMGSIEKTAESYRRLLRNITSLFKPFAEELEKISQGYKSGADGLITIDSVSEMEQKTLRVSWMVAQLCYHVLAATVMTEDGNIAPEAKNILTRIEKEYSSISGEASKLNREKEDIRKLLANATSAFESAQKNYFDKKNAAKIRLVAYGKKKIEICSKGLKPLMDSFSGFEGIDGVNSLYGSIFNKDGEEIFGTMRAAVKASSSWTKNDSKVVPQSTLIEIATYNGFSFLGELSGNENGVGGSGHRSDHDLALWFAEELYRDASEQFVFSEMSVDRIHKTENVVSGITGKENLAQAKELNKNITASVKDINRASQAFDDIMSRISSGLSCYKSIEKILRPFIKSMDKIKEAYSAEGQVSVPFKGLTESEQKVIEMAWNLAKLPYYVLNASVLPENEDECEQNIIAVEKAVEKELKLLKKDSFKMTGEYAEAANTIWKPYAQKMMFGNFAAVLAYLVIACLQFIGGNWFGLVGIGGALIAFPIFFYFKKLPQSKLFMWRIIRLVASVIVVLGVELIGLL